MDGGFLGALQLVGVAAGLVVAFITMPLAYALSWPWLRSAIIWQYSEGVQVWAPFLWSCLLFVLIYASVRAALYLIVALGGLVLALVVTFKRWRS